MGVFEHFPYVNYHELNLSWILRKIKELEDVISTQIVDLVARAGVAENAQAISNLTETVETVSNTATAAGTAASEAQAAATAAGTAANEAQTAATNAASTASTAQTTANAAQTTANTALATANTKSPWEWTYVNTVTGAVSIPLPASNTWNEVFVKVLFGTNKQIFVSDTFPKQSIPDGLSGTGFKWITGSYSSATDYHTVIIDVSKSNIKLEEWFYNGSDRVSICETQVYVR